jgi:hypothetical protein
MESENKNQSQVQTPQPQNIPQEPPQEVPLIVRPEDVYGKIIPDASYGTPAPTNPMPQPTALPTNPPQQVEPQQNINLAQNREPVSTPPPIAQAQKLQISPDLPGPSFSTTVQSGGYSSKEDSFWNKKDAANSPEMASSLVGLSGSAIEQKKEVGRSVLVSIFIFVGTSFIVLFVVFCILIYLEYFQNLSLLKSLFGLDIKNLLN